MQVTRADFNLNLKKKLVIFVDKRVVCIAAMQQQFSPNPPFNAALTLWVGDLSMEIDDAFLWGVFNTDDQVVSVKLIRGKSEVRCLRVVAGPTVGCVHSWFSVVATQSYLLHGPWWGYIGHLQHGAGYAFVEFKTRETAEHILKTYDGQPIASASHTFAQ
jgi:hypothetical protein